MTAHAEHEARARVSGLVAAWAAREAMQLTPASPGTKKAQPHKHGKTSGKKI